MFHEHVRELIERQCRLLHEETDTLGRVLAKVDPDAPDPDVLDVAAARQACQNVLHRAEAMGTDNIRSRAKALDRGLGRLESCSRIRNWHMAEVMALHGDLASAVDELEPEDTNLYAVCTAPAASAVAPPPAFV